MLVAVEMVVPQRFGFELYMADEADERTGGRVCKVWVIQSPCNALVPQHRPYVCHGGVDNIFN